MLSLLLTLIALAILYYYLWKLNRYWAEKGVNQGTPMLIFGHYWGTITQQQSFAEMIEMMYNIGPGSRYCGMYQFFKPGLVLRDPDLIKQITVKAFGHFEDHRNFITEGSDPILGRNLFVLTGQRWRDMRSTLSPAFTSSKMKFMFSLISKNAQKFTEHFVKKSEDLITIEMRDTFTKFTNDVIANTAFGVELDSLIESENECYLIGKEGTKCTGFLRNVQFFVTMMLPQITQAFKISVFPQEVSSFFTHLVQSNIKSREEHGIVRPDMIHLLMEARKRIQEPSSSSLIKNHQKTEISDDDITAQALVFFFAGFDPVSSLMSFMSYELGINPNIQKKLIQEVDDTLETCNGKLTYEVLLGMKYMDMVVSETLRKWPNIVAVDRVCTKPYTIQPTREDEKPILLKKNDLIFVPVFAIHRDPENYPEPLKFDPERFNDENKVNIKPYTYLPFGSGPRSCIGSRFTLLETKTLFFHILVNFEIVPVEQTEIPIVLNKNSTIVNAENGFWLGLKRRQKC